MNIRVYIYIIAAASFLFTGCKNNKDTEDQRHTWESDAPLTVPYRVRLQRNEKVNLVRNHSFETGRTFALDSFTSSFVVDGWQQVGRHVEWVDIRNDSLYRSDEVYSGHRAIKIVRKTAYETDEQGEGILSDFIRVIPGNYNLSLYTRLENVLPLKARLGTRMYDGVDISLFFYDRNKIPVKSNFNSPYKNQVINASFKSLSFANYTKIPAFGWGKIIGKSDHFPFPEGDIPSDAHYVKILIALKGTGTMWVDSVTFNYTFRNFSITERMQEYTDTTFRTQVAFIPEPKRLTKMASVIFYNPDMEPEHMPLIVVPANADAFMVEIARSIQVAFQKSIEKYTIKGTASPEVRIIRECSTDQLNQSNLIINLGTTDLYRKYYPVLPLSDISHHQQGYFIYSPGDMPNLVILGSESRAGIYYAAQTILQMIDGKLPVFHNHRVVDYPDFINRFYAIENIRNINEAKQQGEFVRELVAYKINGAFTLSETQNLPAASDELQSQMALISMENLFSFVRLPHFISPDDSTLSYKYPLRLADIDGAKINPVDDPFPYLIRGFNDYPELILPPVFHNQLMDNSDYSEQPYHFDEEVKCMYCGSSFYSINTDDADIERYMTYTRNKPVFMDNSMRISSPGAQYGGSGRFYPGKLRLYNIFEPFVNTGIRDHFPKLDSITFFINQPVDGEIGIIRMATAADFMWNANTYSRDYALWKVLISRYGAANARELIRYADKYGMMLEIMLRLDLKIQTVRNFKTGQQIIADLTVLVAGIGERLGSQHKLIQELQMLNAGLRSRLSSYSAMVDSKN